VRNGQRWPIKGAGDGSPGGQDAAADAGVSHLSCYTSPVLAFLVPNTSVPTTAGEIWEQLQSYREQGEY